MMKMLSAKERNIVDEPTSLAIALSYPGAALLVESLASDAQPCDRLHRLSIRVVEGRSLVVGERLGDTSDRLLRLRLAVGILVKDS